MTEQDLEDLARVAYAAYAKMEGLTMGWPPPHQRTEQTIRAMAAAVRDAVLPQVVLSPVSLCPPAACAHEFQPALEWVTQEGARIGRQSPYCRHCGVVKRADFGEVPK